MHTLDNEQPPPALQSVRVIERGEDRSRNKTSKSYCKDVSSIQYRYPCGNLLARIEQREDVKRSWVEGCLNESQKEPDDHEPRVILDKRSEGSHETPYHHAGCHVQRRPNFVRGQDHV